MSCFTSTDLGQCGCSITQTFQVYGCNGLGQPGETVAIYDTAFVTLLASGTTNAAGSVSLQWGGSASVGVKITGSARFAVYQVTTTLTSGGLYTVTLTPATGYTCGPGACSLPLSLTETLSITLDGTNYVETSTGSAGATGFNWDWIGTDGVTRYVALANWPLGTFQLAVSKDGVNCPFVATSSLVCPPSLNAQFTAAGCSFWSGTATITE